ncbi:MAG: 3-hydroxyacyl-CoA dehydrogenase NAD-binding domain-containing protein [Acidobacteria bacterium]|nr:3-hydroxyacyl-CoA dehydrogenase NAD-binding domain-containing protein [Acidobacteriota bacterium]
MPAPPDNTSNLSAIAARLRTALLRESIALVDSGSATPAAVDTLVRTTIGRRLSVAGPFEIWEQIGWDLVQVIAGELLKDLSNATDVSPSFDACLDHTDGGPPLPVLAADTTTTDAISHVAVIGAGLMGHGIALEFAASGRSVRLHDLSPALLADALTRAEVGLRTLAGSGRISDADAEAALGRISTTTNVADCVRAADLVIEAASENLDLKKRIFEQLDTLAPARAILASNTSTFLPSAYAASTRRPEQVIGTHYYNPPHLLPGLEIIRGPATSDRTAATIGALFESIGKQPALLDREIQGFIGNRLQVALLREATSVVEGGLATAAEVDQLVRTTFGRDLASAGPFTLARRAGLETTRAVLMHNLPLLSNRRTVPELVLQKVASGALGVKAGRGFYDWTPESAEAWRAHMADSLLGIEAHQP